MGTGRILGFERVKTGDSSHEVSIRLELSVQRARNAREILCQEEFTFRETVSGEQMSDAGALFSLGTDQIGRASVGKGCRMGRGVGEGVRGAERCRGGRGYQVLNWRPS